MEDYKFLREFNLGDYVFYNKETREIFPVLSPVTNSQFEEGLCSYYATNDVFHTLMTIDEATLPPDQSKYFGSQFNDTPSVGHLIEKNHPDLYELQLFLTTHGVTSEEHYEGRAERDDEDKLVLSGCVRFKAASFNSFLGEDLNVSVECIEGSDSNDINDDFPDSIINHIRRYGPVVGAFQCPKDYSSICETPLYESKDPEIVRSPEGRAFAHAVMITGFGLAMHVPTKRKITYFVIQNNWGIKPGDNFVGRIPCSAFNQAYAPIMEKKHDLIEAENFIANKVVFMKNTDIINLIRNLD